VATLTGPRGTSAAELGAVVAANAGGVPCVPFASPAEAFAAARERAAPEDRILVFGSFLTVADVMRARRLTANSN
jgi:dihydrofolate synthase/folylpolyglutamate synthase